ncbi:hypothetical protein P4G43_21315 [Shigella boydii]|nr:hypothetical protein [Shigella boydii]MDS1449814.1 hypothetical protein [Shigella boydii]MDS1488027.1 hypothetical protein [Shigella boydii]
MDWQKCSGIKRSYLNALDKNYPILKKSPDDCSGLSFYMLENQWQCNGPTKNKICDNKGI